MTGAEKKKKDQRVECLEFEKSSKATKLGGPERYQEK